MHPFAFWLPPCQIAQCAGLIVKSPYTVLWRSGAFILGLLPKKNNFPRVTFLRLRSRNHSESPTGCISRPDVYSYPISGYSIQLNRQALPSRMTDALLQFSSGSSFVNVPAALFARDGSKGSGAAWPMQRSVHAFLPAFQASSASASASLRRKTASGHGSIRPLPTPGACHSADSRGCCITLNVATYDP